MDLVYSKQGGKLPPPSTEKMDLAGGLETHLTSIPSRIFNLTPRTAFSIASDLNKLQNFDLVSWVNGISTFIGYLMLKQLSLQKNSSYIF